MNIDCLCPSGIRSLSLWSLITPVLLLHLWLANGPQSWNVQVASKNWTLQPGFPTLTCDHPALAILHFVNDLTCDINRVIIIIIIITVKRRIVYFQLAQRCTQCAVYLAGKRQLVTAIPTCLVPRTCTDSWGRVLRRGSGTDFQHFCGNRTSPSNSARQLTIHFLSSTL